MFKKFQRKCMYQNIDNVDFLNFLPWDKMVEKCLKSDVLVVTLWGSVSVHVPGNL